MVYYVHKNVRDIGGIRVKRISLEELLESCHTDSYEEQYHYIMDLLEKGCIKPVKAAGINGKSPALYCSYWKVEQDKDYSDLEEELKFQLHPMISVDYYLSHIKNYVQDRDYVLLLDQYLKEEQVHLSYSESVNERSFEIWNREKFLTKEQGRKILARCGLDMVFLNVYETAEPLAYYSHTRQTPQNLLILENKDPFYSMRQHLMEGGEQILGEHIGTLIYGAGKRILRSFNDFEFCVEPYMRNPENRIYYFGDLDYEGIGIYENLAGMFQDRWEIIPFIPAYQKMWSKAPAAAELPDTSEGQNRNISDRFFSYFPKQQTEQIGEILTRGKYIPQEILNISDF